MLCDVHIFFSIVSLIQICEKEQRDGEILILVLIPLELIVAFVFEKYFQQAYGNESPKTLSQLLLVEQCGVH